MYYNLLLTLPHYFFVKFIMNLTLFIALKEILEGVPMDKTNIEFVFDNMLGSALKS